MSNDSFTTPHGAVDAPVLLCFSHLRWGFVWQRPQHLLTRMTDFAHVIVVEEPVFAEIATPVLDASVREGVTVLLPTLPAGGGYSGGFNDATNRVIRALLEPYCNRYLGRDRIVWYYTPMAVGAEPVAFTDGAAVVYDAMDELANFRGAAVALQRRETVLLERAHCVFAGGPSLYRARADRNPNAHCFPSDVDAQHFAPAKWTGALPDDLAGIPGPVIGFYGVLDERIDFGLIGGIAQLRPDWSLVMIGPMAKITDEDLARGPNIHYLGMKTYQQLPHYLAGFDVALLPFARNEATQFISPTKTLEYIAGGRLVVSTPIQDVVDLYSSAVTFGETAEEIVAGIESCWAMSAQERIEHARAGNALVTAHQWQDIADNMWTLIDAELQDLHIVSALRQGSYAALGPSMSSGASASAGLE